MLRRLGGCAVALALLLPAPLLSTTPAAASPDASAAKAAAPKSPLRRDVRLGHKPVRYDGKRPSVRLTFAGRQGQLVELADWTAWSENPCVRKALRRADGRTVAPWATGYWKLPRTGRFTAVLRPCDELHGRMRVQVRKVVVEDALVDGPETAIGTDPNVTHLLRLRVRDGERLSVRPSRTPRHLVAPDRTVDEDLYYGWLAVDDLGRHFVAARPGSTISVSRALDHAATLDGAAVSLANQGVGAREHVVAFSARTGQWMYPELLDGAGAIVTDGRARVGVLDAGGSSVNSRVMTACPGKPTSPGCVHLASGPWQVPGDGSYRMTVAVIGSSPLDAFSLRIRSAAVAPALTLDGPPVTYASTTPGQWVVGPYTEGLPGSGVTVSAGNASPSLTDWRMSLAAGFPNTCGPRDTSNGCPDYLVTTLTPDRPSQAAPQDGNVGPATAVLAVPPDVMGTLEVRLSHG